MSVEMYVGQGAHRVGFQEHGDYQQHQRGGRHDGPKRGASERIMALYDEGCSPREIARETGAALATVTHCLRRHGATWKA